MTPSTIPAAAQHVVGHALAPLAAGLGAGQRLAQVLGGLGQGLGAGGGLAQVGDQLPVLLGPLHLQVGHEVAHALELVVDPGDLLVEGLGPQVEVLAARWPGMSPSFSPAIRAAMSAAAVTVCSRSRPSRAVELGGLLVEGGEPSLGACGLTGGRTGGGEADEGGHADRWRGPEDDEQERGGHGRDDTDGV